MPVVIKEIHIRTVVERRIITETELSEEIIRKIENRVVDKLNEDNTIVQLAGRRQRKGRER